MELFQDRRAKGRGSEKADASLSTLISIYLLILAFLVTIYSISSVELSKVGATMDAVQAAFYGLDKDKSEIPLEYEVDAEDFSEQFMANGGTKPFYQDGAKLIQRAFSLEGGINIREGQGLFIDVPANRFFIGVSHLIRPEFEKFAHELAMLMTEAGPREIREIEIVFASDGNGISSSANVLAQKRLHSLARNLIDMGVKAENIIMGIRQGDTSFITIGFRSKLKNGSELDFADMEGNGG